MSLSNCMRIVNTLHQDDEQALMAHIERLQSEGMPARDAQFAAVHQLMAELESGQAPQLSQRDQVDTPEFKRWFGDWRVELDNTRVNQQLDDWNSGELKSNAVIDLGRPASVLQQFGVPDLPIHMTQRILTKAVLRKHDIDLADLKDFVRNLQAPLAVFGSKLGDGHLVLVTEVRHADGNIIAALDLETTRDWLEINDITSIHPKRDHSVAHWIAGGLLRGYEKAKGRTWLENSAGSNTQQPQVKAALDNAIIYETNAIRKPSKVVDADGKPLVVYHGTDANITEFKVSERGTYGGGIYLTPDTKGASDYAIYRGGKSPTVYPVYVSIKNPATGAEAARVASWKGEENARAELIARGYDGVIDMRSGEIVAFRSEQIKSATGNNGQFDPANPDIRKSQRDDLGFYSALESGIEAMPTRSATAASWKDQIKGLVNKGVVKADEIEWSGINDFLDLQQGKVTKEQIAEYLDANGVQVKEVVLGGYGKWAVEWSNGNREVFPTQEDAEAALDNEIKEERYMAESADIEFDPDAVGRVVRSNAKDEEAKYSQYTLPGGENYREVLLTLPHQRKATKIWRDFQSKYGDEDPRTMAAKQAAVNEGRNVDGGVYKSAHWDQPNILAHIRVNDRTDSEGAKTLFVEEIQSDFQQDYRKQKDAIEKAVESDFEDIVARMKSAGVLEVNCD